MFQAEAKPHQGPESNRSAACEKRRMKAAVAEALCKAQRRKGAGRRPSGAGGSEAYFNFYMVSLAVIENGQL